MKDKPDKAGGIDNAQIDKMRREYLQLRTDQSTWRDHWKQISDYLDPYAGRFLHSDSDDSGVEDNGRRKDQNRINSSPAYASSVFVSGLAEGLIPTTRPWFELRVDEEGYEDNDSVNRWLHDVRSAILWLMSKDGFYNAGKVIFKEIAHFGNAQMVISEHPTNLAHCRSNTIGEYVWALDAYDKLSAIYIKQYMTARQIATEFGDNAVPKEFRNDLVTNSNRRHSVIHAICKNDKYKPNPLGVGQKAWRSVYFTESPLEQSVLRESSYRVNPAITPRGRLIGSSIYGHSPAMECLGDIKMLQKLEKDKLQAGDNTLSPPMLAPEVLKPIGLKAYPRAVTYYPQGVQPEQVQQLYNVPFNFEWAIAEIANVEKRIRDTFYFDVFLAIISTDKQATAYEIARRMEEKIMMIGPLLDGLKQEFLAPAIDRHFDILLANGLLPPPPKDLPAGIELKIEYTSVLAQAQKMVGASSYEQGLDYLGRLAQVKPEVLDNVDADENLRSYFKMIGMPPKTLKPKDMVEQERQMRAMQAQMDQEAQMAASMAQTAKTASETPLDGNSALTAVLQQ